MEPWAVALIIFFLIVVSLIISGVKVVPQSKAYVVERLGAYRETWQTGLHFCIPVFERIAKIVSLKEQVVDFAPQPVITKDNVTMQIDTVVFYQITDAKLYAYGVESPIMAIENFSFFMIIERVKDLTCKCSLTFSEFSSQLKNSMDN